MFKSLPFAEKKTIKNHVIDVFIRHCYMTSDKPTFISNAITEIKINNILSNENRHNSVHSHKTTDNNI